jgi:hypothetical protein
MKSIPAMKNTEKKVTTTVVDYDGLRIETKHSLSSNSTTAVYINGELKITIDKPKEKTRIIAKGFENEHTVTVWHENTRSKIPFFSNLTTGVGILVDDIPVQNSIADPLEHIKNAKSGVMIFLVLLLLKILLVIVQNFKNPPLVILITLSIYVIPFIILLFMYLTYSASPKRALVAGIILGLLESLDYFVGIKNSFQAGTPPNGATILIFVVIRFAALYYMFTGLRNLKKI